MTQQIENIKAEAKKLTLVELTALVLELQAKIEVLEAGSSARRGPKSTRDMTEDDARRIILGDLEGLSHKDAAAQLGLSYGQIYSARGGYTFKNVIDEKNAKK